MPRALARDPKVKEQEAMDSLRGQETDRSPEIVRFRVEALRKHVPRPLRDRHQTALLHVAEEFASLGISGGLPTAHNWNGKYF